MDFLNYLHYNIGEELETQ